MTLIKLDLDDICFTQLERRIEFMKKYQWCKSIEVFESCKMGGYNIILESFWKIKQSAVFHIRYELNDDVRKLVRDMLGIGEDLLFSYKLENIKDENNKVIHSHLWERTKMFKWFRESTELQWQQMKQESNCSLIYTPKQSEHLQQESLS